MKIFLIAVAAVMALGAQTACGQEPGEKARIEFLLSSVEKAKELKFIRNGSEHDGKKAAAHLRMKLQKAGQNVKTAEDFIRLCASGSSLSGQPYLIRYANGRTVRSADYFAEKLKEYRIAGPP